MDVATHNCLMGMYLRAPSEAHRAKVRCCCCCVSAA